MDEHARRPNVVLIMTDDQGAWALGCAGNTEIVTPHLDALAAAGTRFDRFFCASPVCSPARASLYTGLMPSAHGVHDWIASAHVGTSGKDFLSHQRLLTDDLADAGYRLGLVGKWHLGANDRPRKGFVHWFAHQRGSSYYYDAPLTHDGRLFRESRYVTDVFTEQACDFIRREVAEHPTDPFFLALQYTAPHSPWKNNHPADLVDLYAECRFDSAPQGALHPWARRRPDGSPSEGEPDTRSALVGYYAAVTGVDRGVGAVLATLDELGVGEDTMVIFTSDNGFSCGQNGFWGKGNGTSPHNVYDSSVLVPFIVRHPGVVPAGVVRHELVASYDFRATLTEHLGVHSVAPPLSPGRSFAPELRGERRTEGDSVVIVADEYGTVRMLRSETWKYVRRYPDGPDELFDLIQDPMERHNLIDAPEQRQRVLDFAAALNDWFADFTTPRHDGRAVPLTGFGQHDLDHLPGAFAAQGALT